ncbi:MAG TPA: hypothetical protein PKE51_10780, partial [Gemmatimonadaceae bacterium]|nr:hypothetical protein [Gemmatimonadaceae bacterium]
MPDLHLRRPRPATASGLASRIAAPLFIALIVAACGDAAAPVVPPVTPTPLEISLSAATRQLGPGDTVSIEAARSGGAPSERLAWRASAGTITGEGDRVVYQAGNTPGQVTIVATGQRDTSRRAQLTIDVQPVRVQLTLASTTAYPGEPVVVTAGVTGSAQRRGLQWRSDCGAVDSTASGVTVTVSDSVRVRCLITAIATRDSALRDSAVISVRAARLVTTVDDDSLSRCTWARCTLRAALASVRSGDTVRLGDSTVQRPLTGRIVLQSALPTFTRTVHLVGDGEDRITLDLNGDAPQTDRLIVRSDLSVRGLTIRGGRGRGRTGALDVDGIDGPVAVHLAHVRLLDNVAIDWRGGALHARRGASVILDTVEFRSNRTQREQALIELHGGGAVFDNVTALVRGSRFEGNVVMRGNGGGLYVSGGQLTMSDTRLLDNFIETNGNGGGAFLQELRAPVALDRITATGNLVQGTTAGEGGGLSLRVVDEVRLSRSRIEGNRARSGGGLSAGSTNLVIEDTNIENNDADFEAGGALVSAGAVRLERVGVLENRSEFTGGLKTSGASALLRNSTISGNVAQLHSGLTLGGTSELHHVTIAHNRDRSDGFMAGALHLDPAGDAQLNSVLLSRNFVQSDAAIVRGRASNCYVDPGGALRSLGYNLSNDGTCRALDAAS